MTTRDVELKRGLKDVYLDRTQASFIDGGQGKLLYRGYNIHDLAEKSTFEEVVYLLLYGKLPTEAQLNELDANLKSNRTIPDEVYQIIRQPKVDTLWMFFGPLFQRWLPLTLTWRITHRKRS